MSQFNVAAFETIRYMSKCVSKSNYTNESTKISLYFGFCDVPLRLDYF